MRIGLDILGGDFAPKACFEGVQLFLNEYQKPKVFLVGPPEEIQEGIRLYNLDVSRIEIVPAQEQITMHDHPVQAFKQKPNNTIAVGYGLLKHKAIDAFISAGNTGAMLVGASFMLPLINNVPRPTVGTYFPQKQGYAYLVDAGLNMDCKPEYLVGFAQLASTYMRTLHNIEQPRIGLLNVGEEASKGNALTKQVYELLSASNLNFVGNIEGRDLHNNKVDVIVCDGFTGNILLKHAESIYEFFKDQPGSELFNYELYGGAPVLGVDGLAIIGHGISNALAFKNMLIKSVEMVEKQLISNIKQHYANQS